VADHRQPGNTSTGTLTDRLTPPGLAGEDASAYTTGPTTSRTITNPHTSTTDTSDGYDHLASGTPSGVVHGKTADQGNIRSQGTNTAPLSREAHLAEGTTSGTSGRADAHQDLALGSSSGVAAGTAVGAAAAHRIGEAAVHDGARSTPTTQSTPHGSGATEPPLYNILPSGTPSGVNIEYVRRSKELSRD
jgi:hypothetical protein